MGELLDSMRSIMEADYIIDTTKRKKGLFVGMCTKDILYYTDELPLHNHKSKTQDFETYIGGPAANAAITYAALGGDATIATCLGNSTESQLIIRKLNEYGVTVLNFSEYNTTPNISSIFVSSDGKRTIMSGQHIFEVNNEFEIEMYDFILFDCNQQEISLKLLEQSGNKTVVLDAGSWKPNIRRFLDRADIIIASEDFKDEKGNGLLGIEECTAKHKIVTRGEKSILYNDIEISVDEVEVVDTLGAGDIFHGAFCLAYFEYGSTCEDALVFAQKVASESVKYRGPREWIKHWNMSEVLGDDNHLVKAIEKTPFYGSI